MISYASIIFGGGISWSADSSAALEDSLADILNRHVFDDESEIIGQVLVDVGRVTDVLDAKIPNSSPLFRIIQQVGELEAHHIPSPESVEEARRILISGQQRVWLLSSRPGGLETSIGRFAPARRALARLAGGR